jgi:hypothetical protein
MSAITKNIEFFSNGNSFKVEEPAQPKVLARPSTALPTKSSSMLGVKSAPVPKNQLPVK